jgi:hypothetical protein
MGTLEAIGITREGLGHILADNVLYVPTYQRSYAWKSEHVTALLEDLAGAIFKKSQGRSGEYFLGSVVTIKKDDADRSLEVVDGQQRLATTSIIIAAIRDYFFRAHDDEAANALEKEYLRWFDLVTREHPPRLRLNETDNDYYNAAILTRPRDRQKGNAPVKASHRRIAKAYRVAANYITKVASQYGKQDSAKALVQWVEFLRDSAQVIRVTVQDDADAFVIFETLNDRGLELSTSDLLKNYLFGLSGDRISEAKERWLGMTGALDTVSRRDVSVDYIRQLWGSINGVIRKRELFYEIKKTVSNKQAAINFATELSESSILYAAILNPTHDTWNRYGTASKQAIATLRLLRMERVRTLLLALLKFFPEGDVKKAMPFLVSVSVRIIIAGPPGWEVENAFADAAMKIRSEEIKNTADLAKELSKIVPNDEKFEQRFSTARVTNAQLARYYLRALEEAVVDDPNRTEVISDRETDLNLEHIMPQSGRDQSWSHIPDDRATELSRRLGNMTLLNPKVNSQIKSNDFASKVKHYKASKGTRLTTMLADKFDGQEWGEQQIDEWQKSLAKLALKAWPINGAGKKITKGA